jgi:hypothetical protein
MAIAATIGAAGRQAEAGLDPLAIDSPGVGRSEERASKTRHARPDDLAANLMPRRVVPEIFFD